MIMGLTGGIGSGKSTVGQFFKQLGVRVIEADEMAQRYLKKKQIQKKIGRIFGEAILTAHGGIDKKRLAEVVFKSRKKLKRLERILHPPVIREIKTKAQKARVKAGERSIWVFIIPLLFEAHLENLFEKVIVVTSPKRLRIQRASKSLGLKTRQVIDRMRYQLGSEAQVKKADIVIRNNGSKRKLKRTVKKILSKLAVSV